MIGLGVTRLLRLGGVGRLVVVDPSPLRRDHALALGADEAIDPTSEDVTEVMRTITGPGGFGLGARADVVIDCAGAPDALAHALKSVRQGGVVILAAVYGREVPLRPDRIMEKELEVRGSFAYRDEFAEVIAMLARGDLDALAFVSHTFALDQIDEAFRVQMDPARSLKVLVEPGPGASS
jgi:threonine dehydrogenase-like Zn-dependent dehydrogenase